MSDLAGTVTLDRTSRQTDSRSVTDSSVSQDFVLDTKSGTDLPALAQTMRARSGMAPRRYVLAGLVRGRTLGLPERAVLALLRRERHDVAELLDDPTELAVLTRLAGTHHIRSLGVEAVRVKIARLTVARVLAPGRRCVTDRAILAWLGVQMLESGWDTVAASYETIAVELGLTMDGARRAMTRLTDARVISIHAARTGFPNVWKLRSLADEAERQTARELPDVIGALAVGDESDRAADLIRSVSRPRWGYGSDHAHWLYLTAHAAGVPMPAGRTVRRRVAKTVAESVDLVAAEAAKAEALAAREASRAARMETLGRARADRQDAWALCERLTDTGVGLEHLTEPADRMAWVTWARGQATVSTIDRRQLRMILTKRLSRIGWPERVAINAATAITREGD